MDDMDGNVGGDRSCALGEGGTNSGCRMKSFLAGLRLA